MTNEIMQWEDDGGRTLAASEDSEVFPGKWSEEDEAEEATEVLL